MKQIQFQKQRGVFSLPANPLFSRADINARLNQWFDALPNGLYLLTIKRVNPHRSISQNNLMWAWFTCIAEAWTEATDRPFTAQDVHDSYCLLLLPKRTPKGNVGGSTSRLTTEEMTNFLNRVQADAAAEYGITLPSPDDQYFEAWYSQYQQH